jgi:lipooligosaccharide transport system ATP-binding protein
MDEAEQLCDRLVIMDGGQIVAEGSPRDLVAEHATREVVELRFSRAVELKDALDRVRERAPRVEAVADRLLVYTDTGDHTAALLADDGVGAQSVLVRRASLEDVFLILTGRTLED